MEFNFIADSALDLCKIVSHGPKLKVIYNKNGKVLIIIQTNFLSRNSNISITHSRTKSRPAVSSQELSPSSKRMINAPAGGAQRCGPGGLVLPRPEVAVVLLAEAEVAPAPALAHAASKQGRASVMGYISA